MLIKYSSNIIHRNTFLKIFFTICVTCWFSGTLILIDPDLFLLLFFVRGSYPLDPINKGSFFYLRSEGRKAGEGRKEGRPDPAKVGPDRCGDPGGDRIGVPGGDHGEKPKNRRKAGRTDPPPPQKISVFVSGPLRQTSGITPTLISSK